MKVHRTPRGFWLVRGDVFGPGGYLRVAVVVDVRDLLVGIDRPRRLQPSRYRDVTIHPLPFVRVAVRWRVRSPHDCKETTTP